MAKDPDFVITIAGQDVTSAVRAASGWEVVDDEENMSQITVEMANIDLKYTDLPEIGAPLSIRFGYVGDLSGAMEFPIAEIRPTFPSDGNPRITVVAYDETQRLGGEKMCGNFAKGTKPKDVIQDVGKANGMEVDLEGDPAKWDEGTPLSVFNEDPNQVQYRMQGLMREKKGRKGPATAMPKKAGKPGKFKGRITPGASGPNATTTPFPQNADEALERARQANNGRDAAGDPVTANLTVLGYPKLRAKKCIAVANVGQKYSGKWYAKNVKNAWRPGSGYRSVGLLIRGGVGKGEAGGAAPMVRYAEIEKKGKMYVGPRKLDGEVQATFTYGDGTYVFEFEPCVRPQTNRGGGEGKGHVLDVDYWNKGNVLKTEDDETDAKEKDGQGEEQ